MPRYNRCQNPALANDLTGWLSGATITRVTGQAVGNTGRVTAAQVNTGSGAFSTYLSGGNVPTSSAAAGGKVWSWVAWVYSSVTRTIRPGIIRWNGTSPVAAQYAADVTLTAGTWTQVRGSATIPTGTYTALRVHIDLPDSGSAGQLRMSAVRIEQITDTTLTYADGSTPDTRWSWDGTAGSSSSTQSDSINASPVAGTVGLTAAVDAATVQLAPQAQVVDFAVAATGTSASVGTDPDAVTATVAVLDPSWANDRANPAAEPVALDVAIGPDASVDTVAITRAPAAVVAALVATTNPVAATAARAPALIVTVTGAVPDPDVRVGSTPAVATGTVLVAVAITTQVALADVYPSPADLAASVEDAETRSIYAVGAVGVAVALRTLGALVPRGNLARLNLDGIVLDLPPGLRPRKGLHPRRGLRPSRRRIVGVDVTDLRIPDLDAAVTVVEVDGAVLIRELDAAVTTVELGAVADTRGT